MLEQRLRTYMKRPNGKSLSIAQMASNLKVSPETLDKIFSNIGVRAGVHQHLDKMLTKAENTRAVASRANRRRAVRKNRAKKETRMSGGVPMRVVINLDETEEPQAIHNLLKRYSALSKEGKKYFLSLIK